MKNHLLLITCIASLASCSSTHKIKQSVYKKTDSTGTSISQASGKRSIDSSTVKVTKQSHKDGITINFGDEGELDIAGEDPLEKANDLAGPQKLPAGDRIKKSQGNHMINIDGRIISSDRPIKSIDITSAGKTTITDINQFSKKDSGQESKSQISDVTKVEETKSKDVERHGTSVAIVLGVVATLIFGFIIAARLGAFRKRNFEA